MNNIIFTFLFLIILLTLRLFLVSKKFIKNEIYNNNNYMVSFRIISALPECTTSMISWDGNKHTCKFKFINKTSVYGEGETEQIAVESACNNWKEGKYVSVR